MFNLNFCFNVASNYLSHIWKIFFEKIHKILMTKLFTWVCLKSFIGQFSYLTILLKVKYELKNNLVIWRWHNLRLNTNEVVHLLRIMQSFLRVLNCSSWWNQIFEVFVLFQILSRKETRIYHTVTLQDHLMETILHIDLQLIEMEKCGKKTF